MFVSVPPGPELLTAAPGLPAHLRFLFRQLSAELLALFVGGAAKRLPVSLQPLKQPRIGKACVGIGVQQTPGEGRILCQRRVHRPGDRLGAVAPDV